MSKKYINADALLNHLYSHQDEQPDVAKVIAEFPAADVKPNVRGEWIYKDGKTCCSICFSPYGLRYDGENNFCPNCGADNRPKTTSADMRGEDHENII